MRFNTRLVGAAALLGLAACGDALNVPYLDVPDVARVLYDAASVEQAVAGLGPQVNNTQRASESVNTQGKILAEETFASVANFGMAARVANRQLLSNELGNDNQVGNRANYDQFQRVQRLAFNSLSAYKAIKEAGRAGLVAADENRMRAFAYLIAGQALAYTSFAYDSAAIGYEGMSTTELPPLSSAAAVNAKAIEYLDSAVTIAGRTMSDLPAVWLSQAGVMTQANFIRLARSYRARARAGVARTPAERAALPWATIIADATNGITADHVISINGTTGWGAGFDASQIYVAGGWHSIPMKYIGMADTTGAYQAWAAAASANRRAFLVVTPDKRWPAGTTRGTACTVQASCTGQQWASNILAAGTYIRNRPPGDDVVGAGDGESYYDHRRYGLTQSNTSVAGTYVDMSKTEIDMLAAEGYIRTGNPSAAETLIDISRVRNGLRSVVGVGAAGRVPANTVGGTDCVPKLPNGTCGTLLEAMKYEKRMETMFTGYMIWFTDSRGWGDLPQNTATEWPVPYQEMQARQKPYYNGSLKQTAASTYGF